MQPGVAVRRRSFVDLRQARLVTSQTSHFTPDMRWIVFRSNMFGPTCALFAVESEQAMKILAHAVGVDQCASRARWQPELNEIADASGVASFESTRRMAAPRVGRRSNGGSSPRTCRPAASSSRSTSTSAATSSAFVRWGANDGPDDAFENFNRWPELHALGASDEILQMYLKG